MLTASNSFLLMHIKVKVFRGISKDLAELTKTAQMEKTADYTGIVF
jgi:hypothetical protein